MGTMSLILERSSEEFKKEFLLNSTSGVLGTNLAFMKVFSSGIYSELQKNFRTRNSSRKSARGFLNAIPQKTTRCPTGPFHVRSVAGWICEKSLVKSWLTS